MKIYKVEYLIHGKSHAMRIEGTNTIPEAVQAAEAILNKVFKVNASIRGVFEIKNNNVQED